MDYAQRHARPEFYWDDTLPPRFSGLYEWVVLAQVGSFLAMFFTNFILSEIFPFVYHHPPSLEACIAPSAMPGPNFIGTTPCPQDFVVYIHGLCWPGWGHVWPFFKKNIVFLGFSPYFSTILDHLKQGLGSAAHGICGWGLLFGSSRR